MRRSLLSYRLTSSSNAAISPVLVASTRVISSIADANTARCGQLSLTRIRSSRETLGISLPVKLGFECFYSPIVGILQNVGFPAPYSLRKFVNHRSQTRFPCGPKQLRL